jgi:hypothetical protein
MSIVSRRVAAAAAVAAMACLAATARADRVADACLDYLKTSEMMKQVPADVRPKYCSCLESRIDAGERSGAAAIIKSVKTEEAQGRAARIPEDKAGKQYFDAAGACLPILMGGPVPGGTAPAAGAPPRSAGAPAAAPQGKSEIKTLAKAGGWEAFGGVTGGGQAVCGLSIETRKSWFSLKYFKGDKFLTVQLGDSEWSAKPGDKVTVSMRFDDGKPWRAEATAFKLDEETALEFNVDADNVGDWMTDFKDSDKLRIVFVDTKVPSWTADLDGTREVGEAMEDCVEAMGSRKRRR